MRSFVQLIVTVAALAVFASAQPARAAQHSIPLSRVASRAGLTYTWLGAERAIALSRPGLVVIVRPGQNIVEVNDRVVTTAETPHYANGDIYVSSRFAARIEQFSQMARQAEFGTDAIAQPHRAASSPNVDPMVSGTISLAVRQLVGGEAVVVSGSAPPSAPVLITLLATLSSDLPTVVVSRHDLQPDANGKFQAVIPIASDFLRGSILKVLATSTPGITEATARIIVGPPNLGSDVPVDKYSGTIW